MSFINKGSDRAIKVGDVVKVEKLIVNDYVLHPTFAIGNNYKVASVENDSVSRPLKYGLEINGEIIHFDEEEIVKINQSL